MSDYEEQQYVIRINRLVRENNELRQENRKIQARYKSEKHINDLLLEKINNLEGGKSWIEKI